MSNINIGYTLSAIEERLKNPFILSFFISLLLTNWQPILILLLADGDIEYKINIINNEYASAWKYLYFPLIIAGVYSGILPILMSLFGMVTRKSKEYNTNTYYSEQVQHLEGKLKTVPLETQLEVRKKLAKDSIDLNARILLLENEVVAKTNEIASATATIESNTIKMEDFRQKLVKVENENSELRELKKQIIERENTIGSQLEELEAKKKEIVKLRNTFNLKSDELNKLKNNNSNYLDSYYNFERGIITQLIWMLTGLKNIENEEKLRSSNSNADIFLKENLIRRIPNSNHGFELTEKGIFFITQAIKDKYI